MTADRRETALGLLHFRLKISAGFLKPVRAEKFPISSDAEASENPIAALEELGLLIDTIQPLRRIGAVFVVSLSHGAPRPVMRFPGAAFSGVFV